MAFDGGLNIGGEVSIKNRGLPRFFLVLLSQCDAFGDGAAWRHWGMDRRHGQLAALALDDHFRARTDSGQNRGEITRGFRF